MRIFFHIFTVFFLFLPGFPELCCCLGMENTPAAPLFSTSVPRISPQEKFLFIPQQRTADAMLFSTELNNLIRNILQAKFSYSGCCSFQLKQNFFQDKDTPPVELKYGSDGRKQLHIPGTLELLCRDREELHKLVSLSLLAAAALPLEWEKKLRSSWLVAAIVHKNLNHTFLHSMPYTDNAPAARVLTSYGIYPALKTLLTEVPPTGSISGDLYGQYSSLLLAALLRRKFFSGEDFYNLIKESGEKGTDSQYDILYKKILQKLKTTETPLTCDEWFALNIKKELSNSLQPDSLHQLEKRYLQNTFITGTDRSGKEKRFSLFHLTDAVKELENPDKSIFQILNFLQSLANTSPGNIRNTLLALRQRIIATRNHPSKENQALLDETEQNFFRELEKHLLVENFLRKTEESLLPPGTRFFCSLEVLKNFHAEKTNIPRGKKLDALLENTRKLYSEDSL